MEPADSDGIKIYSCVSGSTVDNTMAKCNGSIFSGSPPFNSSNTNAVNFYRYGSDGCWSAANNAQLRSFERTYGRELGISGDLSIFTSAYSSVPLKFTTDGSYDYVVFQGVFDSGAFKILVSPRVICLILLLSVNKITENVLQHKHQEVVKMMTMMMMTKVQ